MANYTTSVVGNVSVAWITKVVGESKTTPFFAYVAPKAAHEPFNPAPWYRDHWCGKTPLFFEFSLSLSREGLGKMIIFI